jgi:hypothetical protein
MAKEKKEIVFQKPNVYKAEQFNQESWNKELKEFRDKLFDEYFTPFKLTAPGYVIKKLDDINKLTDGDQIAKAREKARQSAEVHYLVNRPVASEPMPENVKEQLREISNSKKTDLSTKYPWAVPGSTRFDKDRGESLTDVKCLKCKEVRSVISRQTYQMKICQKCKK